MADDAGDLRRFQFEGALDLIHLFVDGAHAQRRDRHGSGSSRFPRRRFPARGRHECRAPSPPSAAISASAISTARMRSGGASRPRVRPGCRGSIWVSTSTSGPSSAAMESSRAVRDLVRLRQRELAVELEIEGDRQPPADVLHRHVMHGERLVAGDHHHPVQDRFIAQRDGVGRHRDFGARNLCADRVHNLLLHLVHAIERQGAADAHGQVCKDRVADLARANLLDRNHAPDFARRIGDLACDARQAPCPSACRWCACQAASRRRKSEPKRPAPRRSPPRRSRNRRPSGQPGRPATTTGRMKNAAHRPQAPGSTSLARCAATREREKNPRRSRRQSRRTPISRLRPNAAGARSTARRLPSLRLPTARTAMPSRQGPRCSRPCRDRSDAPRRRAFRRSAPRRRSSGGAKIDQRVPRFREQRQ